MNDQSAISEIVKLYFTGTYHGDAAQLRLAFHPNAHITGNFKGQICDWTLDEFIARVTATPTAATQNDKFDKEILLIDIANDAALVKARVVVNNITFIDYITLLKIDGKWVIRNKSFTT